jgi:hypothetical protein
MEPDRGLTSYEEPPPQPRDLLSSSWCSSAIQVLQTEPKDYSMALVENPVPTLETEKRPVPGKCIFSAAACSKYFVISLLLVLG